MTEIPTPQLRNAEYVLSMLERLSADSIYAHRASGLRGSLLRLLEQRKHGCGDAADVERLAALLNDGYDILEKAAAELLGWEVISPA